MPGYDQNRIADLEVRLAEGPVAGQSASSGLEMLADLYVQADSYVPALETIDRLLSLPGAGALSATRRAALESKAVACRLSQGDCLGALAQAREALAREAEIESPTIRCLLLLQCSAALLRLSRLDDCRQIGERGLAMAEAAADFSLVAQALNILGRVAYRVGDLPRARDLYEEALALYRRLGDDTGSVHSRNNLGLVHKNLCEWETAAAHFRAALEVHQRCGQFAETANPLGNLGVIYLKCGDWDRSAKYFAEARQVCERVGDRHRATVLSIGLASATRLMLRFEEAEGLLRSALESARELGARREEVLALEFLGEVEQDRGNSEAALALYAEALPLAERVAPEGDLVLEIERRRAEALCALGRFDLAEAACGRAQRLAHAADDRLEEGVSMRVAGQIALGRGRRQEALHTWKRAAAHLVTCREKLELGRTYLELGRTVEDPGEARRYLYRAGSLFADLATPHWLERSQGELERTLGKAPAVVSAAPSLHGKRLRAPSLVACSLEMSRVEALAERAACTELSVLVTGETGTGKELIARTIHSLSPRLGQPFLALNCGALRPELALSQLFGHRKGAFTGAHADGIGLVEAAGGGTLFLDEIGELPLDVQVTLLRFLETGEYFRLGETQVRRSDVRVIAATNRELRGADEKLFRRDLLFRLNEIEIRVPSLKEREEDIVPLARHFLAFYGGIEGPQLAADAEAVLRSYPWPGNVRELENVMKRIGALHGGDPHLDARALIPFLSYEMPTSQPQTAEPRDQRAAILSAYAEARGNKSRTAELLGVSRKTLYARLKRFALDLN